jgi:arsenite-transporting ATPase
VRRLIVFTGKGGTGKTTIAAATAAAAARRGVRTLAMSTDPAHSLGDAYDCELGDEPTELAPNLFARQIDPIARVEKDWGIVRNQIAALLDWAGTDSLEAEELAILPGLEELFALADLVDYERAGDFDAVIVDAAPTAETLRLLALPEVLRWWMSNVWPVGRGLAKIVRPVVSRVSSIPFASDETLDAAEEIYEKILASHALLSDPKLSSVRLVFNAEKVVLAETRRTYTYLCLFGYPVDAAVANKLVSLENSLEETSNELLESWTQRERKWVEKSERDFEGLRVLRCPYRATEPVGLDELVEIGDLIYGREDPLSIFTDRVSISVSNEDGRALLEVFLPLTTRKEIDVYRKGPELYIRVGNQTRNIHLPHSLARRKIESARYRVDTLTIAFSEDRS